MERLPRFVRMSFLIPALRQGNVAARMQLNAYLHELDFVRRLNGDAVYWAHNQFEHMVFKQLKEMKLISEFITVSGLDDNSRLEQMYNETLFINPEPISPVDLSACSIEELRTLSARTRKLLWDTELRAVDGGLKLKFRIMEIELEIRSQSGNPAAHPAVQLAINEPGIAAELAVNHQDIADQLALLEQAGGDAQQAGGDPDQAAGGAPDQAAGGDPDQAAGGDPDQAAGGDPDQAAGGDPDQAAGGDPDQAAGGAPDPVEDIPDPEPVHAEVPRFTDHWWYRDR